MWPRALPTRLASTWRRLASSPGTTVGATAPPMPVSVMRRLGVDGAGVLGRVGSEHREVDVADLHRPPAVEPGQHEKVLDQAAHPAGLSLDAAHGAGHLRGLAHGALPVQLGVAADRCQRGAQLVGGVGDELAHPLLGGLTRGEGLLDLGEHGVERARQRRHLVVGLPGRDAPCQVARGDRGGGVLDLAERPEGPPHGIPPDHPHGRDDGEADQQLEHDHPPHVAVDVAHGHGDDEGRGAVGESAGDGPPAHRPVGRADREGLALADPLVVEGQARHGGVHRLAGGVERDRVRTVHREQDEGVSRGTACPACAEACRGPGWPPAGRPP